jgi:hypothetical protein
LGRSSESPDGSQDQDKSKAREAHIEVYAYAVSASDQSLVLNWSMAQIVRKELVEKHNSMHRHIAADPVSCENEIRDRRLRFRIQSLDESEVRDST